MFSDATIRAAHSTDAAAIAAIYAPYVTGSAISFEEVAPTVDLIAGRMAEAPRLPWLVAISGGAVAGYAYAGRHSARAAYRWSADVSIYLAPTCLGRGLGTALYERLLGEVRDLGYVSAYAGIALPNPASVRLHERLGFKPVGVFRDVGYKHGRWHDVAWWHLPLAAPPVQPAEPRAWSSPSTDRRNAVGARANSARP